jgi:hypothetical protein
MKQATQKVFTDVETGFKFRLYTSNDASNYHLIAEGQHEEIADGCEVNGFYISAHSDVTIRLNTKSEIKLTTNQFYNLKEGEAITHKKYLGFKKFTKA